MKMKNMRQGFRSLCVVATLVLVTGFAHAGYVNVDGNGAFDYTGPIADDFTTLGTAWDPGVNTGRFGPNPAPGGATWSVMGAGLSDASGFDDHSGATTSLLSDLYAGGVDEITTIDLALNLWAADSGFTNLGQVADGNVGFGAPEANGGALGDIRIGAVFIDGAVGGNVLGHAYQPGTEAMFGAGGTIAGDVHFDDSNIWSDGGGSGIDFFTVALHEFGHALGLGHSAVSGSVMEAIYTGPRRTLSADDIAGIQAIYGPNNAVPPVPEPATMTLMGIGLIGLAYRRRRQA